MAGLLDFLGSATGISSLGYSVGSSLSDLYSYLTGGGATGFDDLIGVRQPGTSGPVAGVTVGMAEAPQQSVGGQMAYPMTLYSGPRIRGLIPFTGQYIPGTKVVYRLQRRGTPDRAEGYYQEKIRHRNPCNIAALRRALSRIDAFHQVVKKVVRFKEHGPILRRTRRARRK